VKCEDIRKIKVKEYDANSAPDSAQELDGNELRSESCAPQEAAASSNGWSRIATVLARNEGEHVGKALIFDKNARTYSDASVDTSSEYFIHEIHSAQVIEARYDHAPSAHNASAALMPHSR
jgi:hypothetical protein